MELSTQHLVRRLCDNIAKDAFLDPRRASQLSAQLFDTAFSALIGLNPVSCTCCQGRRMDPNEEILF
jgi:hypothetical protein